VPRRARRSQLPDARDVPHTRGDEVVFLTVVEIDPSGRAVISINFDEDDVAGAFRELDARYLEGEGAAYADVLSLVVAVPDLYNRRDWEGLRSILTGYADGAVVDHRLAGWGAIDGVELATYFESMVELAPDVVSGVVEFLEVHLDPRLALFRWRTTGHARDGGEIAFEYVMCTSQDRDGAWRTDMFDLDDLTAARELASARCAELAIGDEGADGP
jgi:hypothetical protein